MILWGPGPNISWRELEKAASAFSRTERDQLMMIFRGDIDEEASEDKGISREELERGITWLRANKSKHNLDDDQIVKFQERVEQYF